ncbi:hypothetical protein [Caballeronia terrestris]|jgi:hypothetical protein|uniref:hypothetical protein n=1 Tax=Caballeronia terrestris TaxID=1226301 RepID=UPI000F7378F2|nr:hypothetical protein [Caballeronia terrestris]
MQHWVNMIVSVTVGAAVVLALIAVFDIVFRSPRGKRLTKDQSGDRDYPPPTSPTVGTKVTQAQELKHRDGPNN